MTSPLPDDFMLRTRRILLPLVETEDEREALLADAFYLLPDSRLYHLIKRDGTPMNFTTLCITQLLKYGCITDDLHALGKLLKTAMLYCGKDKHAEIASLMNIVNLRCAETGTEPSPDAKPPVKAPASLGIQNAKTPQDKRTPTVFISYSHVDDAFAQKLRVNLNAAGHACWMDTSSLRGGADWQRAICDGINLSYALVVVCTHQSLQSEYVWDEIQWARTRGKLIVPLLLEDVTADDRFFGLHRFQGVRFDTLPFAEALAGLLEALPPAPDAEDAPTAPRTVSRRQLELAYLDRLRFDDFRLEKFELAEYASLAGVSQQQKLQARDSWEALAMQQEFAVIRTVKRAQDDVESAPEAFTDAVSRITELRRVVVLGEPGAGKTHTLRAIAKPLYTAALSDPKAPIPVLVKLGNWDKADEGFESFLRRSLGELGTHLDALFDEGRVILLLDGLNEFPADQREKKYPQVEAFIKAHPDVMAVVTCREADYPISLHLNKVLIRPLDPLRIRDFARRALRGETQGDSFFWKLSGDEQVKAVWEKWERAGADWNLFWTATYIPQWDPNILRVTNAIDNELWHKHVQNTASIMRLARNPYMLRMLLDVYIQYKGALPSNRGQLFDQFVNVLLKREKLAEIDPNTQAVILTPEGHALVTGLQKVAFEMQVRRAADDASAGTSLPLATVRGILNDRLLYLAVSTSILNSGDKVRFSHQLLQEYFAAKHMNALIFSPRHEGAPRDSTFGKGPGVRALQASDIWKPENWWERTNWEEAVILLAGLYSDDCTPVVEWVNAANPEVAAQCVMRSGAKLADATREKLRAEWLSRLTDVQCEPNPHARAAIGRALGLTDWDNRKGVGVVFLPSPREAVGEGPGGRALPDIDWVHIPAGEFTYQKGKLTLDYDFQIARYPVTYAQFQTFIDDPEGFHDARWWEGLADDEYRRENQSAPGNQYFKYWNHPRENVSWYDAVAFCRWYSWCLGGGYALDSINDWVVRLPTEFEWVKAARANTGWAYPYGDEFDAAKGNTNDTGIRQTSAVGIFPDGDTPHWSKTISDLSGNVWEWCLTDHGDPQADATQENIRSATRRVLRGGSWDLSHFSARSASRSLNDPYDRNSDLGFRLLRAPSR